MVNIEEMTTEDVKKMKKDFDSLIENFWYILQTRDSTLFPKEIEDWRTYAKDLAKKYEVY